MSSKRTFRLVVNLQAGSGGAKDLADHCRARMRDVGIDETADDSAATVVIFGGDGTLHDYLNTSSGPADRCIALVPCGTANALYSSFYPDSTTLMQSFDAALRDRNDSLRPLPLAQVDGKTLACVVVSTALHASILYDSEALRSSIPGVERFKIAAQSNMSRTYPGRLSMSGEIRRYSPARRAFVTSGDAMTLEGPFSYALLATLTDRLEPNFIVAPLRRSLAFTSMNVVIIRPSQRPNGSDQSFADEVLSRVTQAMYSGGQHIDLVYDNGIRPAREGDEDLPTVVEYFRCSKVEWTSLAGASDDIRCRLLCVDGVVTEIPVGRSVIITTATQLPRIWL